MKREILDILACPVCKGELELSGVEKNRQDIVTGSLYCEKCNLTYPIVDSIPNLFLPYFRNYLAEIGKKPIAHSKPAWSSITASLRNKSIRIGGKVIPSKAKPLVAHLLRIQSKPSLQTYKPYEIDGQLYGNSPEEKFFEIQLTNKLFVDAGELHYHASRLMYYRTKVRPLVPLLDTLCQANPSLRVVDICSGAGVVSYTLSQLFPSLQMCGVEMCRDGILLAHGKLPGIWIQGDTEDLPIANECADVVLFVSALHHFYRYPDRILSQCVRIMKPGGYLFINDSGQTGNTIQELKVKEIKKHMMQVFEILYDLVGDKRWPPVGPDGKAIEARRVYGVATESSLPYDVIDTKLREVGLRVVDSGYFNYVGSVVCPYLFGFDIALAIDALLDKVAPKGAGHVYFIARKE